MILLKIPSIFTNLFFFHQEFRFFFNKPASYTKQYGVNILQLVMNEDSNTVKLNFIIIKLITKKLNSMFIYLAGHRKQKYFIKQHYYTIRGLLEKYPTVFFYANT